MMVIVHRSLGEVVNCNKLVVVCSILVEVVEICKMMVILHSMLEGVEVTCSTKAISHNKLMVVGETCSKLVTCNILLVKATCSI